MDAGHWSPTALPPDTVAAAFKSCVMVLQDLNPAHSMFPAMALSDLTSVNTSVTTMESQVQDIHRHRRQEELDCIPKAKKLIEQSLKQEEKLQHVLANLPSGMLGYSFGIELIKDAARVLYFQRICISTPLKQEFVTM